MNRSAFHPLGLFALSVFLCLVPALSAKPKDPTDGLPPPPPQPVPRTVKVLRGAKAEIPLEIYGSQPDELHFFIRTKPEHGKLSEPEARGREAAVVTYEPPADLSLTRDHFSYSTRGPRGVSAPSDIQIVIFDKTPQLGAPNTAEFPALVAGASSSQTIDVVNSGGGMLDGEVETEAPWRIDGAHKYHLGAGAHQSFTIVFAPAQAGTFNGEVRFSSQHDRYVLLSGKADPVLAVTPAQLDLQSEPGGGMRRGSVEIVNNSDKEITVTLSGTEKLHFPKAIPVPAKGRASVSVESSATDPGQVREEIRIAGAGAETLLAVRAAALGATLRSTSEGIRLVPEASGHAASGSVTVENAGGTAGSWKWEIAPPFQAASSEGRIESGARQAIGLRVEAAAPGRFRGQLIITGEQQKVEIPVEAILNGEGNSPAPPAQSAPRNAATLTTSSAAEIAQPPAPNLFAPPTANGKAPTLGPDEHVSHVQATQAIVTWPSSLAPGSKFKLEERILSVDPQLHQLKYSWAEHPPASLQIKGNEVIANLKGLKPEHPYNFRISPLNGSGTAGEPFLTIHFHTTAQKPFLQLTPLAACFAGLLLLLGYMGWQKFRTA